jgi:hypothetical protein
MLPATFFDSGQSLCLSRLLLKTECPACGMTRGIMHLIHFDFEEAFAYNMMSFVVLPFLVILWVKWLLLAIKQYKRLRMQSAGAQQVE